MRIMFFCIFYSENQYIGRASALFVGKPYFFEIWTDIGNQNIMFLIADYAVHIWRTFINFYALTVL